MSLKKFLSFQFQVLLRPHVQVTTLMQAVSLVSVEVLSWIFLDIRISMRCGPVFLAKYVKCFVSVILSLLHYEHPVS